MFCIQKYFVFCILPGKHTCLKIHNRNTVCASIVYTHMYRMGEWLHIYVFTYSVHNIGGVNTALTESKNSNSLLAMQTGCKSC